MSGVLTIKEGQKNVKKIRVPTSRTAKSMGIGTLLTFLFWFIVLMSGLYLLSDITNNFSDIKDIISRVGS